MPQPTTNSWPFEVKEAPSADGHTGGVVAGVGIIVTEMVGNKLADAGAPGLTIGPLETMLLDGPEVPVPGNTEYVDTGAFNGFPLELDDNGAALGRAGFVDTGATDAGPDNELLLEVLVLEGTIRGEEVDEEVLMGLIILGVLVPKDES